MQIMRAIRSTASSAVWRVSALLAGPASQTLPLRVVSGADRTHFLSLCALLASIQQHEPTAEVHLWDLGLTDDQRAQLERRSGGFTLTRFPYERYPDWMDISRAAGEYAWKPTLLAAEAEGFDGLLIWLDAGDRLIGDLRWIRRLLGITGFYSPYSPLTVRDWTHPGTLAALHADDALLGRPNVNGAIMAFDLQRPAARELLTAWAEHAVQRDVIAPPGSSRENHRQDQALLTVLAHQRNMVPSGLFMRRWRAMNILIHQDVDSTESGG